MGFSPPVLVTSWPKKTFTAVAVEEKHMFQAHTTPFVDNKVRKERRYRYGMTTMTSGRRGWRVALLLPHWLLLGSSVLLLLAGACDHHGEHVRGHRHDHQHGSSIARRGLQEDPEEPEVCGTEEPTEEEAQAESEQLAEWEQLEGRSYLPPQSYWIPLWFHIVQEQGLPSDNLVTDERIFYYVDYLNNAFKDSVFFFDLRGTSRTTNTYWANNGRIEDVELAFKRAAKQGGMESLNIYLVHSLPPPPGETTYLANWVGFAYLPSSNAATGDKDGAVVTRSQNEPGNDQRPNTLVHEVVSAYCVRACGRTTCLNSPSVLALTHSPTNAQRLVWLFLLLYETKIQQQQGHWLGLLHTFAGGCNPGHSGDLVDDTPAHFTGGQNCDDVCCFGDNWDSCPNLPGIDPVE